VTNHDDGLTLMSLGNRVQGARHARSNGAAILAVDNALPQVTIDDPGTEYGGGVGAGYRIGGSLGHALRGAHRLSAGARQRRGRPAEDSLEDRCFLRQPDDDAEAPYNPHATSRELPRRRLR